MPIWFHPETGTVVICDFDGIEPEMTKRRPAIVVSPDLKHRDRLCTVVPLSTTPPDIEQPYHCKLIFDELLPPPYDSAIQWVKGDMLATVSFDRLFLPRLKIKDDKGKRQYVIKILTDIELKSVRECILHALSLSSLTKHL